MTASFQSPPLACDHGLRREAIVEVLLREVVQGRLRPGEHLVTQALADRFGVSHTPIREALIALAGMGIVDLLPNRGSAVRRLAPEEVREILQVRRALECEAVRGACGRIASAVLSQLRDDLQALAAMGPPFRPEFIDEARATDSRLHDTIAGSCGNSFLAKELGRLKILFRAFRDASWESHESRNDFHRLVGEAREHGAIVEALLAGDRKEAVRAMARHIHSGNKYWCRALPVPRHDAPRRTKTHHRDEPEGQIR